MKNGVIYDFHGTLVDVSSLHHLLRQRDYDTFYEESLSCPPIESTVLAAQHSHRAGYANLLMTGMPDRYSGKLADWLERYDVPVAHTWMRLPRDKYQKDFVVKRRMYLEAIEQGYRVIRAFEDSPQVYDLWIQQGIPTELIPGYQDHLAVGRVDNSSLGS